MRESFVMDGRACKLLLKHGDLKKVWIHPDWHELDATVNLTTGKVTWSVAPPKDDIITIEYTRR